MKLKLIAQLIILSPFLKAQNQPQDTTHKNYEADITIVGKNSKNDILQMPEVVGTNIYAGKKNALIIIKNVQGDIVNNNMRQVMAKIPGIHIWESDPSGIQIGIAARGLSPNRSWEFNIRQNGYDIAADPYGYPEAYYNPPLQAVQRIEVVRGQGSLQYGPQFGGLVNYILRNGSHINKKFAVETQQTAGSNGLWNSYNAIGGQTKKSNYYAFLDYRRADGYRANSAFNTKTAYITYTYKFNPKFNITTEIMGSNLRSQQPGGLTDVQLQHNIKQSFRSRNWFNIGWLTPAIIATYKPNGISTWQTKLFATLGDRNSVGFLQSITTKDSINSTTGTYNNRALLADAYRNIGLESRYITQYTLGKKVHTVAMGLRLYTGTTHRRSDGKGTTGNNYTMQVVGDYARDINFKANNAAAFVENVFKIGKRLILIPGIRAEYIFGSSNGQNGLTSSGQPIMLQNVERSRTFIISGIGAEYHLNKSLELYANISQAFRPIQFANLQAPPTTDIIDENLKDSKGYNADLGVRGTIAKGIITDISVFYLQYNNRIGTITPTGSTTRLVTNVGASTSKGVEWFTQINYSELAKLPTAFSIKQFISYAFSNAIYGSDYKVGSIAGKKVENAPKNILRTGLHLGYKNFMFTPQVSSVSSTFSDANNTIAPSANGQAGIIPSYTVTDFNFSYLYKNNYTLQAGINNVTNEKYFTRRAGGYPGPGAMPANGRTFFITLGANF
jgi:Fe(3+) dicitrate transport protein